MKAKLNIIISFLVIISFFLVQSVNFSPNELNANDCNVCHGSSHLGHVSYSISLGISETILNSTINTLTATIINNNFPLRQSSITLVENADFKFEPLTPIDSLTKTLGTLGRRASTVVSWNIKPFVTTNKSISIQTSFTGTAIDHKTNTFTTSISKNVFVSTAKIALLQVQSNPLPDTSLTVGDSLDNGTLIIKNNGVVDMENVHINTTGNVLVDGKSSFSISKIEPGSQVSYKISIDTSKQGSSSISIIYSETNPIQSVIIPINIQPQPPIPISLTIGRILGYVTYVLLFLSVLAGAGVYHLKKFISGRKIRILHADLSNLSFTMAVIHAVILTIGNSPWVDSYSWFELIPQLIPIFLTKQDLGIELGRWILLFMYIGTISGYYIAKIIKKFGRRLGISIHMLTYLALIFGLIHAMLIGGLAKANIFIPIIMFISILSIGWLKYDTKIQLAKKKAERLEKHKKLEQKEKPEKGAVTTKPIYTSSRRTSIKGLPCPKCSTINEDDAFFCKRCANPLEGIICPHCGVRNTMKVKICISCKKKLV